MGHMFRGKDPTWPTGCKEHREWVPTAGAGRGEVARKQTGALCVPLQSFGMPPEQTAHSLVNSGTKNEPLCWNPLHL